jgi:hypothetical protein
MACCPFDEGARKHYLVGLRNNDAFNRPAGKAAHLGH